MVEKHLREQAVAAATLCVGRLAALPLHPQDHRKEQKEREDVGGTLRRQGMQDWLVSDDGKAWREGRGDLFQ